jgi:perosamine synthetase
MPSEPGAPPPAGTVPLAVPDVSGREWDYVRECLDTGWVSSAGPRVEAFERTVAERLGVRHAVAVASGTAALHAALRLAGVGPGDEVLVSALTFVAPGNAVTYLGAEPVFVDAEPEFGQIDVGRVAGFLAGCRREGGRVLDPATGRRVAALLPVHAFGHPVDLDPLAALAREHGVPVVEDATESLGSLYKGRPVGRPLGAGDLACLSFNGNKIVTTGGGGMLLTDDDERARRARWLTTQAKDDPVESVHGAVGWNYRLSNVAAAIGCAQMERLDEFVGRKRAIAERYERAFQGVGGLRVLRDAPWATSNRWLTTVVVDAARFGVDRRTLMRRLGDARIEARPPWQPLHRSPAHPGARSLGGSVAEDLHERGLSLPSSVGLSEADQDRVVAAVLRARRPVAPEAPWRPAPTA